MTNSDKFKQVFGLYATELWAMTETEFLAWLNADTQPERKTGKWILHKNGDGTCNQCHFRQSHIWDLDNWQNYCGHCGVHMTEAGGEDGGGA